MSKRLSRARARLRFRGVRNRRNWKKLESAVHDIGKRAELLSRIPGTRRADALPSRRFAIPRSALTKEEFSHGRVIHFTNRRPPNPDPQ